MRRFSIINIAGAVAGLLGLLCIGASAEAYETAATRDHKKRVASVTEFLRVYKSSKDTLDFLERSKIRMSDATYAFLKEMAVSQGAQKLARIERRGDLELVFFENGKVVRYVLQDGAPGRALINNKLVDTNEATSIVEAWNSIAAALPKSKSVSLWSLFASDAQAQVGAAVGAAEAAGAAAAPIVSSVGNKLLGAMTSAPAKVASVSMASAGIAMTYNQGSDIFGDKCKGLRTAMTACVDAQSTLNARSRSWASSRARKELKFKRATEKYLAAKAKGEDPDPPDDIGGLESEDGYIDAQSKVVQALGEVYKALYDDSGIAAGMTRNNIQCAASPIIEAAEACKKDVMAAANSFNMSIKGFDKPSASETSGTSASAPKSGPAVR